MLGSDAPVVGPVSAKALREFSELPEPPQASRDQIETMIGKLAIATAQPKVSQAEADERVELYWLALRDLPVDDLRTGFLDLVRTATFLPTPAEVRKAAINAGSVRRHAKSRARYLAWLHDRDWRPAPDGFVDAADVRALIAGAE